MHQTSKIENLKNIVENYSKSNNINLEFITKKLLDNGNYADFQIKIKDYSLLIGNITEYEIIEKRNKHYYFKNHPFIGGGYGNCWVFFDGIDFVYHNIWLDYPDDNFTSNFYEVLDSSINNLNEKYDF